jgi:hypothetical protein
MCVCVCVCAHAPAQSNILCTCIATVRTVENMQVACSFMHYLKYMNFSVWDLQETVVVLQSHIQLISNWTALLGAIDSNQVHIDISFK